MRSRNLFSSVLKFLVIIGITLSGSVLGLEISDWPRTVEAGKTYTLRYNPVSDTPTTFILMNGETKDLGIVANLTTSATGGKFSWTVAQSIPNAPDYSIEVKQGALVNYIGPVALTGSNAGLVSSVASVGDNPAPTPISTPLFSSVLGISSTLPPNQLSTSLADLPTDSASLPLFTQTRITSLDSSTTGKQTAAAAASTNQMLSTGAKAGIGIGVAIAGLALALGAFLLGVSARRKNKAIQHDDKEAGNLDGKPEIDGKEVPKKIYSKIDATRPELDGLEKQAQAASRPTEVERSAEPKSTGLDGQILTSALPIVGSGELSSEPGRMERDCRPNHALPTEISDPLPLHELPNTQGSTGNRPIPSAELARRDTYDDPQLVQNPWA